MTVVKIKKQKTQKGVIKRKPNFENYKSCLEAAQILNSLSEDRKEFIKNNKLILKTQQRLKIQRQNTFTEEINKIALGSNDDKRMQSFDLIETYAYGTNKVLVSEKDKIKRNNIIKQCTN